MLRKLQTVFVILALASSLVSAEARLSVPTGHQSIAITGIHLSQDGRFVLSVALDSSAILWDYATGKEIVKVSGVSRVIGRCALSPDARTLYSGKEKTLRKWDLGNGRLSGEIGAVDEIRSVAITWDGKFVLTDIRDARSNGSVVIRDSATLAEVGRLEGEMATVRSRKDGNLLYVNRSGELRLVSLPRGDTIRTYPNRSLFLGNNDGERDSAILSPDGLQVLKIADGLCKMETWNLATGKKSRSFDTFLGFGNSIILSLDFSPDGKFIATSSQDKQIRIWESLTGKLIRNFKGESSGEVRFSSDGNYIITAGAGCTLVVCETASGRQVRTFDQPVEYEAFAAGIGDTLIINGFGAFRDFKEGVSFSKVMDAGSGKALPSVFDAGQGGGHMLCSSPRLSYLLFIDATKTVNLLDRVKGTIVRKYTSGFEKNEIIAISEDGKRGLGGQYEGNAKIWDMDSGKSIKELPIKRLAKAEFSLDGKLVFCGFGLDSTSWKNKIAVLDASNGRILWQKESETWNIAISPDGTKVLVDTTNSFEVYEARTGKIQGTFNEPDKVSSLAFSPDGKLALSGSMDGSIRLYDLGTGTLIRRFEGYGSRIGYAAFFPNMRRLYSRSGDGTVRIWDASSGREIAKIFAFADGSWVTITPDGYFDSDATGARNITVVDGLELYSVDQFFEKYHRPDIVAARLQLRQSAEEIVQGLVKDFAPPPTVSLSVRTRGGSFAPAAPVQESGGASTDWLVEGGTITVRVAVKDGGGGIDGLRLFVNGKAWGDDLRGLAVVSSSGADLSRDYVVQLAGDTTLRAVGFSRDRTESAPLEVLFHYTPAKHPEKPVMWVLAAGADEYQNPKYRLNYALADARGFVDALSAPAGKLFARVEVTRLFDSQLSRESLVAALDGLKSKVKPEDVFVFFYAGHGIAMEDGKSTEFYFVMPEVINMADPEKLVRLALPGTMLRNAMAAIPATKQLILVDACNSGAFAEGFATRGAAEDIALAQLSRSSGAAVISSTTDQQFASEVAQLGHGVFTFALLEGLSGKAAKDDGRITAGSLRSWIEDQLPALTVKYRGVMQYPTAFIFGQDFPVGLR